jgi:hypothetical protein
MPVEVLDRKGNERSGYIHQICPTSGVLGSSKKDTNKRDEKEGKERKKKGRRKQTDRAFQICLPTW